MFKRVLNRYNNFWIEMQNNQQPKPSPSKSTSSKTSHLHYSDFESLKVLGMGAYGKVELVIRNGVKYALKTISKKLLSKEGKQYQAFIERELMRKMQHPGVVQFKTCFQDKYNLYFCLQYCEGGDFTTFMRHNQHRMNEKLRVFYVAQIVNVIQYFQSIGIVHRDLKPQNILLSQKGHLKIIDYGTAEISNCKILDEIFKQKLQKQKQASQTIQIKPQQWTPVKKQNLCKTSQKTESSQECEEQAEQNVQSNYRSSKKRKATFVGTCFYVPPQLLEKSACYPSADLWALGCIIYQLYYLTPPFDGVSQFEIFEKIKNLELKFPQNQSITEQAIDLIKKLLQKDPYQRLGCNSRQGLMMKDLKMHPYFKGINFETLFSQQIPLLLEQQHTVSQNEKKHMQFLQNKVMRQYLSLLQGNPNILIHGLIEKRTFITYNLYYLIVFNNLKMLRIKIMQPGKTRQCEINMDQPQNPPPANLLNSNFFKLTTKQKTYKLKASEPAKWVSTINKRFKQLKQIRQKLKQQQKEGKEGKQTLEYENQNQNQNQNENEKQRQSISQMLKGIKFSLVLES